MTLWNQTQDGANLLASFEAFRDCYTTQMPAHIQSLSTLAVRPITG